MLTEQAPAADPRVVVGVDGSRSSRQALRWAQFMAQAGHSTVEVVAAWQPYNAYGWMGGWAAMPDDWNPGRDAEKALTATIDSVFGAHRPAGLTLTLVEGNPVHVLLQASLGAQLLVVGSRGHGGFAGMLLGSVSAACAEHARCPVLVVHGDQPVPGSPGRPDSEGVSP